MLDTRLLHWTPLAEIKSLNIIWKANLITHMRGRLFLPSHDLRNTFEDKIETVVLKIDWTQKPKKNV